MLRLTRLEIRKFDGVAPTTLTFGPGFNVLLGKNATGKTTLLEIIAEILRDTLGSLGERSREIDLSYELSTDAGPVSVSFEAKASSQLLDAAGGDRHLRSPVLREVRIAGRVAGQEFTLTSNGAEILHEGREDPMGIPAVFAWSPVFLSTRALSKREAGLSVRNGAGRLDEGLDVWGRWLGPDETSNALRLYLDQSIAYAMTEGHAPDALRDGFQRRMEEAREAGSITAPPKQVELGADEIPPLREALDLFDLRGARVVYVLRESKPTDDQGEIRWSSSYFGDLTFERRDGSVFSADLLSFGQKRMLTFLLYEHSTRDAPAVLDELVNGLHYEWIELCVEKLRDRQTFLSAQNPLLLDLLGFESAADVRSTFLQCRHAPNNEGTQRMEWSNFSEEQADRFYDAYAVGIQHVHEILKSEDLW